MLLLLPLAVALQRDASDVASGATGLAEECDKDSAEDFIARGYQECPGEGCVECTSDTLGYQLAKGGWKAAGLDTPRPSRDAEPKMLQDQTGLGGGASDTHYALTLPGGQKVKVVMPKMNSKDRGATGSKNCFAFATHQKYQIPGDGRAKGLGAPSWFSGKSPVDMPGDIDPDRLAQALALEEAVFLGRTSEQLSEPMNVSGLVEGRSYYIVAVLYEPMEYHFWGLWNNGWHCTSSKAAANVIDLGWFSDPKEQCMSGSIFSAFRRGKTYSPDHGGFYLFPCRGDDKKCGAYSPGDR